MTDRMNLAAISIFLLLFPACRMVPKIPHDPCQNSAFLTDLSKLQKSEAKKLVRLLESSSYGLADKSGCRAALLGRVYDALGNMSKASDYFSEAAKKLPELYEYFMFAKAHIELKRKRYEDAARIANALLQSHAAHLSSQFALRVRHILAEIAVAKRDDAQIIDTHNDLLAKGFRENEVLLFNLAQALTNLGEHKKANEVYKRLLVNFPHSKYALDAERRGKLAQISFDHKDVLTRFEKLVENLAFLDVVKDADNMLNKQSLPDMEKSEINSAAVKALLNDNRFQKGIHRAEALVRKQKPSPKDFETYAFGLLKVGRFIEAAEYYGKFGNVATNKEDQAKACFFKGFSFYEANLYAMAQLSWERCQEKVLGSSQHENFLWYQALASMLDSNHEKSYGFLRDLKRFFPKSQDFEKYQYFIGYNLHHLKRIDEGNRYHAQTSRKSEPGYYALLARKALGRTSFLGANMPEDALSRLANDTNVKDCKSASVLYRLGFREEARDLVLRSKAAPKEKLGLLQHMGFYHDAAKRAHQIGGGPTLIKDALRPDPHIRAAYPKPYRALIDKFSKKYRISPNLLYAIMKNESGFSESAKSSRGALGLMQMMPFTAKELASHLGNIEFSHETLIRPEISIELGALLIAILQKQFNDPHLVIAAYNAGPHQVQKWLDRFGHLPVELFIERLPFQQTRAYVKKVLFCKSLYDALNGQDLHLKL